MAISRAVTRRHTTTLVRSLEALEVLKVDVRAVMALRRLTEMPVTECRDALVEAGGDLDAVLRQLSGPQGCGPHATDAEVTAVLASCGLTYSPPKPRQPVMLSDSDVIAELTAEGLVVADSFLMTGCCARSTPVASL